MFYSQFILAKKGPLGTIWIAAHLERKLRKNQVADTDIGVSVDSILFPEVPIALRLSSHLLLGVVRIYSRKVNYLFNDCSEALLKIKQAFRSTAVDLPPEESTAPYHSITLPETFDLDDFELPDNAVIHGNYDHHVSTRDQITLQDTVEDMGYPTSQFGLDEMFGDGDASQIVLDLDEDLFSNKTRSPVHTSVLLGPEAEEDPQTSRQPPTSVNNMDVDDYQNKSGVDRNFEHMLELTADSCVNHNESNTQEPERADGFAILPSDHVQTPDLNDEVFPCTPFQGTSADLEMMDVACPNVQGPSTDMNEVCSPFATAQAPSTPGLMQEAIPASVQGVPALNHFNNTTVSSPVEVTVLDATCNSHLDLDLQRLTNSALNENMGNPIDERDLHNVDTGKPVNSSLKENISDYGTDLQSVTETSLEHDRVLPEDNLESKASEIPDHVKYVTNSSLLEVGIVEPQDCSVAQRFEVLKPVSADENACLHIPVLQPCSMTLKQSTLLTPQDELTGNALDLLPREEGFCILDAPGTEGPRDGLTKGNALDLPSGEVGFPILEAPGTVGLRDGFTEGNALDFPSGEVSFPTFEAPGTEGPRDGLKEGTASDLPSGEVRFPTLEAPGTEGPRDGLTKGNALDLPSGEVCFPTLEPPGTERPLDGFSERNALDLPSGGVSFLTLEAPGTEGPRDGLTKGNALDLPSGEVCFPTLETPGTERPLDGFSERNALDLPSGGVSFLTLEAPGTEGPRDGLTKGNALDLPSGEVCFPTLEAPGTERPLDGFSERNALDLPSGGVSFLTLGAPGTEGPRDWFTEGNALNLLSREASFHTAEASRTEGPQLEIIEGNTSYLPAREVSLPTLEAPVTEGPLDYGGQPLPARMQGEGHPTEVADLMSVSQQKLVPVPSETLDVHNVIDECLDGVLSSDIEARILPPRETLLLTPTAGPYLSDNLVIQQYGTEKEASVYCEQSIDVGNYISGKKRPLMENTPVLLNGNPSNFFEGFRYKKSADFVPNDDDILASILVGRRTPVFKLRPTPPEVPSLKRRRMTTKPRVQKRKVLLDGAMVLQSDAIRAQLTNTEDIRRVRRKAPCNPPEIWLIKKYSLEDQILEEPLLTGVCSELADLYSQTCGSTAIGVSHIGGSSSMPEMSKELEVSRGLELIKETSVDIVDDLHGIMPETKNIQVQKSTEAAVEAQIDASKSFVDSHARHTQATVEILTDIALSDTSEIHDQVETVAVKISTNSNEDGNLTTHATGIGSEIPNFTHSGNDCNASTAFRIESSPATREEGMPQRDGTALFSSGLQPLGDVEDLNGDNLFLTENTPFDASFDKGENKEVNDETLVLSDTVLKFRVESHLEERMNTHDEILVPAPGNVSPQTGADVLVDSSSPEGNFNPNLNLTVESNQQSDLAIFQNDPVIGRTESESMVVAEVDNLKIAQPAVEPKGNPSTDSICANEPVLAILVPAPGNFSHQTGADVLVDSSSPQGNLNPNLNLTVESKHQSDLAISQNDPVIGGIESESKVVVEIENLEIAQPALEPEGNPTTDSICANEPVLASCLMELNVGMENVPKYDSGENPSHQEVNLEAAEDAENSGIDIVAVNDSGVDHLQDLGHTSDGNNTEFLNMDDELEHEEDLDNITSEEAQFLDNSGWSSRTRAVTRYLQYMFDSKDVPGSPKVLHMDRLLVGKSRKEASRMFFETLVLKTREYIHVEQEKPFASIDIHPTQKLMKSEF